MTETLFNLVGGIGLFLLGMVLLTDGLKTFAGEALRGALIRFTGTPAKAFCSGALVTALVQSSSATTVAVIGFVSAGLLSFPQALGVVMGASFGTTGTGWIIAGLGLKISLGFYALPLVGAGALLRLLGRGRVPALGLALAGFGLIFIGIETLQTAMRGLSALFDLAVLPAGGLKGHLLAMLVGVVLTVLMQSSSAAVATTLTALHTAVINFEQAAALVIGAAVGTTITGVLATIGAGVPARRTALAHVGFNLATGLVALVLLPVFLRLIIWAQQHLGLDPGVMSLAAFHTAFIGVGVAVFLPRVNAFARLIERWVPERDAAITRHLDATLLATPPVALEATRRALVDTSVATLDVLLGTLAVTGPAGAGVVAGGATDQARVRAALERIESFLPRIPSGEGGIDGLAERRIAQAHAIDHLSRLQSRFSPPEGVLLALRHPDSKGARSMAERVLVLTRDGLQAELESDITAAGNEASPAWREEVADLARRLAEERRGRRPAVLARIAAGRETSAEGLGLLDAMRWLDRLGYHAWRIGRHLGADKHGCAGEGEMD